MSLSPTGVRYLRAPAPGPRRIELISSRETAQLTDISQQEFIEWLQAWTSRGRLQVWAFLLGAVIVAAAAVWSRSPKAIGAALGGALALWLIARWWETARRRFELEYSLPAETQSVFDRLERAMTGLSQSNSLRSVTYHDVHGDWKRHAGATRTVFGDSVSLRRDRPAYVQSELRPVSLRAQGKTIYFFPDRLLVREDKVLAALSYEALDVDFRVERMRWFNRVPRDAREVGESWLYVNKDGSPDERFRANRQVPIILVGELILQSSTGMNIVIEASSLEASRAAADALRAYADVIRKMGRRGTSLPPPTERGGSAKHRLETVIILRGAASWFDLNTGLLGQALSRDAAYRKVTLTLKFLDEFLSDWGDLLRELDAVFERTLAMIPREKHEPFQDSLMDLRANVIGGIGSAITKVRDAARAQDAELRWNRAAHEILVAMASDPTRIVDYVPGSLLAMSLELDDRA